MTGPLSANLLLLFAWMGLRPLAAQSIQRYEVSSAPTLRIEDDGSPAKNFGAIVAVSELNRGRLLVAERQSGELRIFDANGQPLQIATRRGEGPNEVGSIAFLRRLNDAIVVYDRRRAVWFDSDSVREKRRETVLDGAKVTIGGVLGNGRFWGMRTSSWTVEAKVVTGVRRDSVEYVLLDPTRTRVTASLGPRLASTSLTVATSNAAAGMLGSKQRLGHHLHVVGAYEKLWFGDSGERKLSWLDTRTGSTGSTTLAIKETAWRESRIAAERARLVREVSPGADRELALAELDSKWRPKTRPYYSSLYADYNDGLWVELFEEVPTAQPRECLVLNASGAVIATVVLPNGLQVMEIGRDYVLGVRRNADDLLSVERYRLERAPKRPS